MTYDEFKDLNRKYSGSLSTEKFLSKNYNKIYEDVIKYSHRVKIIDKTFKEKLYYYFNSEEGDKVCVCGKKLKLKSIELGYSQYCGVKCSNLNNTEKIKKRKEERYGNPNYNNKEKFKKSISEKIARDGNSILEKRRNTKMLKYGNPNYTNTEKIQISKKLRTISEINKRMEQFQVISIDIESNSSHLIYCEKCKNESLMLNSRINSRIRNGYDPCPVCNNYNSGISHDERDLANYIDSLGINIIRGDRKILNGREIDILIPDLNLGRLHQ